MRGRDLEWPFHGVRVDPEQGDEMRVLRQNAPGRENAPRRKNGPTGENAPAWQILPLRQTPQVRGQEFVDRGSALAVDQPEGAFFRHLTAGGWPLPLPRGAEDEALILEPVVPDAWEDRPWASRRQLQERVELFRGTGKTPPAEQRR